MGRIVLKAIGNNDLRRSKRHSLECGAIPPLLICFRFTAPSGDLIPLGQAIDKDRKQKNKSGGIAPHSKVSVKCKIANPKSRLEDALGEILMNQVTVDLIPDKEIGGFTARIADIPAYGEGETEEEAIAVLKEAIRGYIEAFGLEDALARLTSGL